MHAAPPSGTFVRGRSSREGEAHQQARRASCGGSDCPLDTTTISGDATEVILRARSSNIQAISLNVSTSGESDPTVAGANAMILFPGESIRLPADPATGTLLVKYIIFNDAGLAEPELEIVEIVP